MSHFPHWLNGSLVIVLVTATEFNRFKRFQEYEREQAAAGAVAFDATAEADAGTFGRYIASATHRHLFRFCAPRHPLVRQISV